MSGIEEHEGLKRRLHLVTLGCHGGRPYLAGPAAAHRVLAFLEEARRRYGFLVVGYAVLPERVGVLLSEPAEADLERAIQTLKTRVARAAAERPFWMPRFERLPIDTDAERVLRLRALHREPVRSGLVVRAEQWPWSSYRAYRLGEPDVVRLTPVGIPAVQAYRDPRGRWRLLAGDGAVSGQERVAEGVKQTLEIS